SSVEAVGRDARYAIRMLGRSPGFAAAAVVTLALGIGANTAVFSIVNGLLLRTLPVTAPDRLVTLSSVTSQVPGADKWTSSTWEQVRRRRGTFDGALAWAMADLNLAPGGEAQPADGLIVDGEFFATLGVSAIMGRTFARADDTPGG